MRPVVKSLPLMGSLESQAKQIFKKHSVTLFDPSPATCYSDSAGSTPTTQDGVVGCIVDSNATLGPELVTNGTFSSDTAWTKYQPTSGSVTISGGVLTVNSIDGSYCAATQDILTSGKLYRVAGTVTAISGVAAIAMGTNSFNITSTGSFIIYLVSAASNTFQIKRITACNMSIDNVSVREVVGYIATQSTAGYKPILRRGAKNLLLNSATLSTQNVTTAAVAYTLQFKGTGTVTLSGTSTAGPLVGTGVNDLVKLTFTPTAGTLTLTVSGSVTSAMLETGSTASPYVATTSVQLSNGTGNWWLNCDSDDLLSMTAIPGASAATVVKAIRGSGQATQTGVDCTSGLTINTDKLAGMAVFKTAPPANDLAIVQKYMIKKATL